MRYRGPTRATRPPMQATLVYDGECPFCCASARWIQRHAREQLLLLTFEDMPGSGLLTVLSRDEIGRSAHCITPGGIEYHGGESVTQVLRLTRLGWLGRLLDLPLATVARDITYAGIDRARPLLSRFVRGECRGHV
ncbi:MAG: DUF393 domain-containing protein [Dehalococcoidia bacterium]|nr:DUF393 domain-containing protein [Dehalococcoidia bacterium]